MDTLDKDLAVLGKMVVTGWRECEYNRERVVREGLGRKRWFKRCCGERMYVLIEESITNGTENLTGSRRQGKVVFKNASICLKCGYRLGAFFDEGDNG